MLVSLPVEITLNILEECEYQGVITCMLVRIAHASYLSPSIFDIGSGGRLADACMTSSLHPLIFAIC